MFAEDARQRVWEKRKNTVLLRLGWKRMGGGRKGLNEGSRELCVSVCVQVR